MTMSSATRFVVGAESIEVVACCEVVRGWVDDATAANREGTTIPCSRASYLKN
jgi:hypothetical protein